MGDLLRILNWINWLVKWTTDPDAVEGGVWRINVAMGSAQLAWMSRDWRRRRTGGTNDATNQLLSIKYAH